MLGCIFALSGRMVFFQGPNALLVLCWHRFCQNRFPKLRTFARNMLGTVFALSGRMVFFQGPHALPFFCRYRFFQNRVLAKWGPVQYACWVAFSHCRVAWCFFWAPMLYHFLLASVLSKPISKFKGICKKHVGDRFRPIGSHGVFSGSPCLALFFTGFVFFKTDFFIKGHV